jgi:hypothetical protein
MEGDRQETFNRRSTASTSSLTSCWAAIAGEHKEEGPALQPAPLACF